MIPPLDWACNWHVFSTCRSVQYLTEHFLNFCRGGYWEHIVRPRGLNQPRALQCNVNINAAATRGWSLLLSNSIVPRFRRFRLVAAPVVGGRAVQFARLADRSLSQFLNSPSTHEEGATGFRSHRQTHTQVAAHRIAQENRQASTNKQEQTKVK